MSRTIRSSKGYGYDYWSKRADGSAAYYEVGSKGKKLTHRKERSVGKQKLFNEITIEYNNE